LFSSALTALILAPEGRQGGFVKRALPSREFRGVIKNQSLIHAMRAVPAQQGPLALVAFVTSPSAQNNNIAPDCAVPA